MSNSSKSLFVNNTISQGSNVFEKSGTSLNPTLKRIINELLQYSELYILGDLETLQSIFNLELYTRYSKILYSLKQGGKGDEEIMRKSTVKFMATLFTNIAVYQNYQLTEQNNIELREEVSILHDPEKLNKYVQDLANSAESFILGNFSMESVSLSVNREYVAYIRAYGYPPNGVFDPDLLGYFAQTQRG